MIETLNRKYRRAIEKSVKRQQKKPEKPPKYKAQAWWKIDDHSSFLLQALPHEVLENFRLGKVQEGDFDTLAMRVNWCKVACRKFAPEHLDMAEAAILAMLSVKDRHNRIGQWGMSGQELKAVGDALNAMDDLQTQVRRVDLNSTMRDVFRLAAIGHLQAWHEGTK